jgi:hypothetical protein
LADGCIYGQVFYADINEIGVTHNDSVVIKGFDYYPEKTEIFIL